MNILVTDKDAGPSGWEVVPMDDVNVFFDPQKVDEEIVAGLVSMAMNGDMKPLQRAADYDLTLKDI
jgi:hypothetical protein